MGLTKMRRVTGVIRVRRKEGGKGEEEEKKEEI